jgi:cell division protein FtsZ
MTVYSYIEEAAGNQANIKVIGIGGGGCNAVERMLQRHMRGVEFLACNTDMLALQQYHAPTCLQLGRNLTRGLGAGGNPKIGRAAALEDDEMIRQHLTGADMLFITAGMGGGTGTGGAPVIARAARDLGILTVAVVTLPFRFEGKRRQTIAEAGIMDLEHLVDTLIVVPNEKILAAVEPDTTVRDAFFKADEILSNAVQGISDLITEPGDINVDFADVRTIMTGMGKAILGTGIGTGENRAISAVDAAVSSPFLDDFGIEGARGILINITGGSDLGIIEMNVACERIRQAADEDALIIVGHVFHSDYNGKMKITIIATGFDKPRVPEQLPLSSAGDSSDPEVALFPLSVSKTRPRELRSEPGHSQVDKTPVAAEKRQDKRKPVHSAPVCGSIFHDDSDGSAGSEPGHLRLSDPEPVVILPSDELVMGQASPPVLKPVRPELEPLGQTAKKDDFHAIPDYNERDMASESLKKDSKLDRIAQRIYFGDINTPAFLRRKAD